MKVHAVLHCSKTSQEMRLTRRRCRPTKGHVPWAVAACLGCRR